MKTQLRSGSAAPSCSPRPQSKPARKENPSRATDLLRRGLLSLLGAFALAGGGPVSAADDKADAEALVAQALATVQRLAKDGDFASLKSALAQAKGVLIFPKVLKAGVVVGGAGGTGVLLARDAASGAWVGPAFYTIGSASLGLQVGVSSAEMMMVVNSQKALDSLYKNKLKLGTEASAAIGSKGVDKGMSFGADFVVYSRIKGAFAGVAVDGSVLDVRETLNTAYYGQSTTPLDILVKRTVSNPGAASLQAALAEK